MSIRTFRIEEIGKLVEPTTRPMGRDITEVLSTLLRRRGEAMRVTAAVNAICQKHPRHTKSYIRSRLRTLLRGHDTYHISNVRGDLLVVRIR